MKPGPATSAFSTRGSSRRSAARRSAKARGFIRASLASVSAALVARSPCEASRGGSTTTRPASSPAGILPAASRRSRAAATRRSNRANRFIGHRWPAAESGAARHVTSVRRLQAVRNRNHEGPEGPIGRFISGGELGAGCVNTGLGLFGALALGLAVVAVPARAQGWVDPPPRTAAASPAAAEQGAPASQRTSSALPDPTKEASGAQAAGPPGASAPSGRPAPTGTETAARAAPRPERAPPEPSAAAQQLAMEYLAFWSAPNAVTITATPEFYAPLVIFHGRGMTARELFEEKLRFVRR